MVVSHHEKSMEQLDFNHVLPAIWLVFGDTYLTHDNAPRAKPDQREQLLVDLLCFYLNSELVSFSTKQLYDETTLINLGTILDLLTIWSQDLSLVYQIRGGSKDHEARVREMAKRFLQRIESFGNCTVIPNGLISAEHTGQHECVCLAILKKHDGRIDWIQVNPGSAYHQPCRTLAGEKSSAYLEINEIDPENITEDWLYLLVGLKSVHPGSDFFYKEVSLYECLLAHLNGKTVFRLQPDDDFVVFSHTSPAHSWQVVDQSFRYLLRHFLGSAHDEVYRRLQTGFKIFLMEKTLAAYRDGAEENVEQCHFLLHEMCRDVARQALDQGNDEQKTYSLSLIDAVKAAIEQRCSQQEKETCRTSQLDEANILSLGFPAPRLITHSHSSSGVKQSTLQVNPAFIRPMVGEDIIDYLQKLKKLFIDKLVNNENMDETALLCYGIEEFFIEHFAKTDILQKSASSSFSRDDEYLGNALKELAEIYYGCQGQLVNRFLSNVNYQPQFYAKNVTIQFFVYAAVAALNFRAPGTGPLLETYNLSVATSESLALDGIIPHLVIDDARWLKVLFATQTFFAQVEGKKTLFSHMKLGNSFRVQISNDAEQTDIDVAFAYQLLQRYPSAYTQFIRDYLDLEHEKLNKKWLYLAYSNEYLPSLYGLLSKVAHFSKVSLTGFPSTMNSNRLQISWYLEVKGYYRSYDNYSTRYYYWQSFVSFRINSLQVHEYPDKNKFTSYLLKSRLSNGEEPYQRFVIRKENIGESDSHFLENEIVASQGNKPETIDHIRYMQLGFLQSEPQLKYERLYIALKQQQMDFTCEQESVLIKQTLFEISELVNTEANTSSLLVWTVDRNPALIHKLGALCIEKARAMQYRLTQHHAVGHILEVVLGLLTFYPSEYKDDFAENIANIYRLLKGVLAQPPKHLSNYTLLHLNAYLIISVGVKPKLLETETPTILKALLAIQNYKVKGIQLDNNWLLRVHFASFTWCSSVENQLVQNPTLLNDLMLSVIPQWNRMSSWQKSEDGLLFTCGDYAIKPLIGGIYFQNQPVMGLPDAYTKHPVFVEFLGPVSFSVIPSSRDMDTQPVPCYSSVDRTPLVRLTLIQKDLLIEEWIEGDYQRYVPAKELLGHDRYPRLLYELPTKKETFRHLLDNDQKILVKDQQRKIIYRWDLKKNNVLFSLQHEGYLVPWDKLKASYFKRWLERVELSDWIELIAHPSSDSSDIDVHSLHFPRLGLHFDYKQGKFHSKQIHGYVLSEQQHLNTLTGFSSYLVLVKKEPNLERTKVVIPHRGISRKGSFYVKTIMANMCSVLSPAYFVYDYDAKTGLLKGHHVREQLYLALLYYCSASLDDHDASHCNAYHLARENLEICWKDQPYEEVELGIVEQLLSPSAMRDFHSHRVALYLKVVSLLRSSLRLSFLYSNQQLEERSKKLLNKCLNRLPQFLSIYLQNKSTVLARIRLSLPEEEDVVKMCSSSFEAYNGLCFEQQPQVVLSTGTKNIYKDNYRQLFNEQDLRGTSFRDHLMSCLDDMNFSYDLNGVDFSSGLHKILIERFRLTHFITLYKIARSSAISLNKFCYLLHHLVLRAKINYERFPKNSVMVFARALLLVAENPARFPRPPRWFIEGSSVDLSERQITRGMVIGALPAFHWVPVSIDDDVDEEARKIARKKDERENENIWSKFNQFDLDTQGIPRRLPEKPDKFQLEYEVYMNFSDSTKRIAVRPLYLQAAYNDAMFQFFCRVLELCDRLKHSSSMGLTILPFVRNSISITIMADEGPSLPTPEPVNLEKWTIPQQPLIDLDQFFAVDLQSIQGRPFLLETQLEEAHSVFRRQVYSELKDSWQVYHNETQRTYCLLDVQSINGFERVLQTKCVEICKKAEGIWDVVALQLKQRPNSESDHYFALRWYSGQVPHYHKGDILTLLVEPHRLADYNPDCIPKQDSIIPNLLHYVNCEISVAKLARALASVEQYKQAESEPEQFSVLQSLVRSLQEDVDPACYRHPHWLLFQWENEIIVRDNQRELIVAMLNQDEKAMYQLNMGEGKSSVILPLLSYNLANGRQLLRINVLSALLITMKDFLRQRFSGLIRKRVYSLPFYRDTDISAEHLKAIYKALETCQRDNHILLVTPEHRLCLQLKIRELMLENQAQIGATDIFNWQTYRQRAQSRSEVYEDLTEKEREHLLARQDERLKNCLQAEKYIDWSNRIIRVPPRGQGRKAFALFKETINDSTFREWSCLKAAYREILYNSTLSLGDSSTKLAALNEINSLAAIDLLDESDEILKHGTELNYTMGDKYMFAGGELRWQIPQFFIKAIFCDPELRDVITAGKVDGLTAINLHHSQQGGVPFIQLIDESYYENAIKPLLIEKFFSENLPTLRKYRVSADILQIKGEPSSMRHYIAGQLPLGTEKKIIASLADKGPLKDKLLIAKGWLSHGILFHVFKAKYRVEYGLNLNVPGQTPKPIAIPFSGKDAPSPRSEFSHPDVMLGFTIISYLYQGLNQLQLKDTLVKLKAKFSHQVADTHLRAWAEASRAWIEPGSDSFPPLLLTSFEHIDLSDEQCLGKLHQYLSGNHPAIFFYMNQFVLLEEAMQYRYKISANAHSLVGYNAALGFSGTDDRKLTMPYEIKSLRSLTQEGTNGKLLSVLAEERNSRYFSIHAEDTIRLLKHLCHYATNQPHCRALIDAGALVTGLTNYEVATFLLAHLPSTVWGTLYFSDEGNNLMVLTRDGKAVPLQDCYLDKQYLFAYLDDIHTRGTDIKLPFNCHAVLTIGMGMQKDKVMQAAMRLRQLAQKQSVSLWGTQSVTLTIARDNSIDAAAINSLEVIKWVTQNTIVRIHADLFPVAIRKISFQFLRKAEAWLKESPTSLDSLVQCCQDKELFHLEEFYALSPQYEDLANRLYWLAAGSARPFFHDLEEQLRSKQLAGTDFYSKIFKQSKMNAFRHRLFTICKETSVYLQSGYVHNSLDHDQEKEVEVEIIQEQQVVIAVETRDPRLEEEWDARLVLLPDFITRADKTGLILPMTAIRHYVQVPPQLKNIIWHPDIFMTTNYILTVKCRPDDKLDNYLRPVDAVLIHRSMDKSWIVLLSGKEASWIKSSCYEELGSNLLLHIDDIDGPTQLPSGSTVSKEEKKLLTVVKLFSGESHYASSKEVQRVAKRVGRLYPHCFTCPEVDRDASHKLYGLLIEEGYLDFAGTMTGKLLRALGAEKADETPAIELTGEYGPFLWKKLFGIYTKLAIDGSLKDCHSTLWKWVGRRGRMKEYTGSAFESIFNSECQIKCGELC